MECVVIFSRWRGVDWFFGGGNSNGKEDATLYRYPDFFGRIFHFLWPVGNPAEEKFRQRGVSLHRSWLANVHRYYINNVYWLVYYSRVIISANVNHSVDTDTMDDASGKKQENQDDMRSTPSFDVEIKRGNQILCFNCSFVQNTGEGESQEEFSKFLLQCKI